MDDYEVQIIAKAVEYTTKAIDILSDLIGQFFAQKAIKEEFPETGIRILDNDFGGDKGGDKMPPRYADGSIRQKGSIFEYRFMYLNNQKSVCGHSKQECFDKRTAILQGTAQKKDLKSAFCYYGDWVKHWHKVYKEKNNGDASITANTMYIEKDILPKLGKCPIKDLTASMLQDFINDYTDRPNTQHKIAHILRGSLRKARIERIMKYNPFEGVDLIPYKPTHYRALEFTEQEALYNACDMDDYKKLLKFCCCTGIRIGKVLDLTDKNFDRVRKEIVILKKQKRGLKEEYRVPYLDELIEIPKEGKLFPNLTYNSVKKYLQGKYHKLKLKGANIHSFKHTFVSTLYSLKVPIKQIQLWAGHSTMSVTTDTYTHMLLPGDSVFKSYLKKLAKQRKAL